MSLLEQINERSKAKGQEDQQAAQAESEAAQAESEAAQAEAQKPDAGKQSQQKRSDYSNMMSNTPDEEIDEEAPTPEEQEEFTKLEVQVAELVNGDKAQELFKVIGAASDPVEGIGQAAHDIIKLLIQTNPNISPDVLFGLGETAVEQIVQSYEDIDPSVNLNEDQMAEAFSVGLQEWMTENPESVDPDMKQYLAGAAPSQLA